MPLRYAVSSTADLFAPLLWRRPRTAKRAKLKCRRIKGRRPNRGRGTRWNRTAGRNECRLQPEQRSEVGNKTAIISFSTPELKSHLRAWCRAEGHAFRSLPGGAPHRHFAVTRGSARSARWVGSQRAGPGVSQIEGVVEHAPRTRGLAARGPRVEAAVRSSGSLSSIRSRSGPTTLPVSTPGGRRSMGPADRGPLDRRI